MELAWNPDFRERKETLKERPVLKARSAAVAALDSDNEKERNIMARWYLEHRKPEEFNTRSEVAIQAEGALTIEERGEALDSFLSRFLDG